MYCVRIVYVLCMYCVCIVHVLCMYCVCIVYVLCMYCVCTVYVLCMYCVCIVHVLCMYCVCIVYVLCTYCVRIVYVLCMYCVCTVYVLCTHCVRIVYVLCMYCVRIVYALCTYCVCIVYVLCMYWFIFHSYHTGTKNPICQTWHNTAIYLHMRAKGVKGLKCHTRNKITLLFRQIEYRFRSGEGYKLHLPVRSDTASLLYLIIFTGSVRVFTEYITCTNHFLPLASSCGVKILH